MTVDEIRELIALATETGIAELEVQRGENRVRIRRASFPGPQEIVVSAPGYAASSYGASSYAPSSNAPSSNPPSSYATTSAPVTAQATPSAGGSATETSSPKGEKPHDPTLVLVKSPIVGTFYEAASPEAQPFVRMGERVQPGKVLCIIESMKLMNEIECEVAGVIESKLVMNGQPVEYGEALFAVRTV